MSSEDTMLGSDVKFQVGDGNSPEEFLDLCAATNVSGIGESKPQVKVTSYCDDAHKYRNGLADGSEVTVECNHIRGDAGLIRLKAAYDADEIVTIRMVEKTTSPDLVIEFHATINAWQAAPPLEDRQTVTFTMKISGAVTWDI